MHILRIKQARNKLQILFQEAKNFDTFRHNFKKGRAANFKVKQNSKMFPGSSLMTNEDEGLKVRIRPLNSRI